MHVVAAIRPPARQQFAQHGAQREHVGALVHDVPVAGRLLRRHVRRRAQRRTRLRQARILLRTRHRLHDCRLVRLHGFVLTQLLGQAPVHDLHFAELADHDVARLEVAVDHALAVGESHRLAHLLDDDQQTRHAFGPIGFVAEKVGQGSAAHQLHAVAGASIGELSEVVDGHDAGVLQRAGQPGLAEEALFGPAVAVQLSLEDFEGQIALQRVVAAAVHLAHAAEADLLEQPMAGRDRSRRRVGAGRPRLESGRLQWIENSSRTRGCLHGPRVKDSSDYSRPPPDPQAADGESQADVCVANGRRQPAGTALPSTAPGCTSRLTPAVRQ